MFITDFFSSNTDTITDCSSVSRHSCGDPMIKHNNQSLRACDSRETRERTDPPDPSDPQIKMPQTVLIILWGQKGQKGHIKSAYNNYIFLCAALRLCARNNKGCLIRAGY